MEPTIPYELYLFSGLFDPDPTIGKEVKLTQLIQQLYDSYLQLVEVMILSKLL